MGRLAELIGLARFLLTRKALLLHRMTCGGQAPNQMKHDQGVINAVLQMHHLGRDPRTSSERRDRWRDHQDSLRSHRRPPALRSDPVRGGEGGRRLPKWKT